MLIIPRSSIMAMRGLFNNVGSLYDYDTISFIKSDNVGYIYFNGEEAMVATLPFTTDSLLPTYSYRPFVTAIKDISAVTSNSIYLQPGKLGILGSGLSMPITELEISSLRFVAPRELGKPVKHRLSRKLGSLGYECEFNGDQWLRFGYKADCVVWIKYIL